MTDLPADAVENPVAYYPAVFVKLIAESMERNLPECEGLVVQRPVAAEDASMTLGVFPATWTTDTETYQLGQFEPTQNEYVIRIQSMVKASDDAVGRALFSNLAKMIRVILVRDPELRVRLLQSSESLLSSVERVDGYAVTRQDYLDGRVGMAFMFLATTTVTVRTHTTFQNV